MAGGLGRQRPVFPADIVRGGVFAAFLRAAGIIFLHQEFSLIRRRAKERVLSGERFQRAKRRSGFHRRHGEKRNGSHGVGRAEGVALPLRAHARDHPGGRRSAARGQR